MKKILLPLLLPLLGYAITCTQCIDQNTKVLKNYKIAVNNKLHQEVQIQAQYYLKTSDCILIHCKDKKILTETLIMREKFRSK